MPEEKILVLFGSPHQNGATARLLERFQKEYPRPAQWYFVDAYQKQAAPCLGCGYCETVAGCTNPDLDEFDKLLRSCDAMVVATPIYNLSVPAPLKAILDRTQRYFSARFMRGEKPPIPKHKKAVMLLACGADSAEGAEIIRKQLTMIFTILNAELVGEVLWKNTDRDQNMGEIAEELAKTAENLAIQRNL